MVLNGLLVQKDVNETSNSTKKNSEQQSAILGLASQESITILHPVCCYDTPSTQPRRKHFSLYGINYFV
jgi:hypothetical protein